MDALYTRDSAFIREWMANFLSARGIECGIDVFGDILLTDGRRIDAQYSTNFAIFRDLRTDFVSALAPVAPVKDENFIYDPKKDILENFCAKFQCSVEKKGKIFFPEGHVFFCTAFYEYDFAPVNPNYFLAVKSSALHDYVFRNPELLEKVRITDKSGLSDDYGSAFLPIDVVSLISETGCFFERFPFKNDGKLKKYMLG